MDQHREWVDRARSGDKAAFEALFGPLLEPACQLAFTYLHDWQEAEDVVQEASLKAWRAVGRLRDDTRSVRPWFYKIVTNEARSRRRGRWWSVIRLAAPNDSAIDGSHEDAVSLKSDLDHAMQSLGEAERSLLFLYFYLDLPLDEIGEMLGISPQAAKSRLYRATRSLRPAMTVQEARS